MDDPMDTLKGILGDDAEDKIKSVMNSLSGGSSQSGNSQSNGSPSYNANDLEYLMQMKNIMSKLTNSHDDPRSNLLMSLKPYMRQNRQKSIDSAVRLLSLTKVMDLFRR